MKRKLYDEELKKIMMKNYDENYDENYSSEIKQLLSIRWDDGSFEGFWFSRK